MVQKLKEFKGLLFFLLLFLLVISCQNYYKASTKSSSSANLDSLQSVNRYFVLRNGTKAYAMKNLVLSPDKKTVQVQLDSLSWLHKLHLTNGYKGKLRYKKSKIDHYPVLNEVHFYIPYDSSIQEQSSFTLALDKIQKIEVLEKDKTRTTNSYVLGAIGYTAGALALAAIIIAATKSSCPFVSAYNGDGFSLQGEIYGGAIYPQLARHDYLPLKLSASPNGNYGVKISNELQEIQYTDLAELWVISHKNNVKVLPDVEGNLHSISQPQKPLSASFASRNNVLKFISEPNDLKTFYFDDSTSKDGVNELTLQFTRPASAQSAKLLLNLKNSYWLDYLYGELAKGFGSYYATYVKSQRKKTATELMKWVKEQKIPLEVTIKTNEGWKVVTEINTIGPLANRELVIPINLDGVDTGNLELKLRCGFMFWELDAAAIDYSSSDDFILEKLPPASAIDEAGKNVTALLLTEDGKHLEQPAIGNVATIEFAGTPQQQGLTRSFILHSKGYYEHIREFTGKADIKFLRQFTTPNAFPLYGLKQYKKFAKTDLQLMAVQIPD